METGGSSIKDVHFYCNCFAGVLIFWVKKGGQRLCQCKELLLLDLHTETLTSLDSLLRDTHLKASPSKQTTIFRPKKKKRNNIEMEEIIS